MLRRAKTCPRKQQRYIVPNANEIPPVLSNLSNAKVCTLRPLITHTGNYVRAENGYRKKDGVFQLSWSRTSVLENIAAITNLTSQNRCLEAYNYLMNEERSAYREYVEKRDHFAESQTKFNFYNAGESRYVECCLWPHLYPTRDWCETGINGQASREISHCRL